MAMGGDELPDVRWDVQDCNGLQDTSTMVRGGGAAFVPATATSSCMSNQKSDGCSPAIFGQDAGVDAALVDAPKHDTELMLPLSRLPLSDPTFNAAALQMSEEEEEKKTRVV